MTLENHCTFSSIDLISHCLHSYKYLPISSSYTKELWVQFFDSIQQSLFLGIGVSPTDSEI